MGPLIATGADGLSIWTAALTFIGPIIVVALTKWYDRRNKLRLQNDRAAATQIQRDIDWARSVLRDELNHARQEISDLRVEVHALTKELTEWRSGKRVPDGYRLVPTTDRRSS